MIRAPTPNYFARRIAGHWYAVIYRDGDAAAALRQLGRWACHPDLGFTWYDAAAMTQRIREAVEVPRRDAKTRG